MHMCQFCFKEFKKLGWHEYKCKNNPNRKIDYSYLKNKRKPLSDEHKKNISSARKQYLDVNPDKVPYVLYSSSKKSWPEKFFEELLNNNGITGWCYNYPNGRYRYDYAFPELKIDIEIDGNTHNMESVKFKDAERDEFSISTGWKILRIDAKMLYDEKLRADVLSKVISFLNDDRIFGMLVAPTKQKKESKKLGVTLKERNNEKYKKVIELIRISDIDFSKFGWVNKVSEIVGIKPQKINSWMKRNMPEVLNNAYKRKNNGIQALR